MKTNRSPEIGKKYATWAASLCKNTDAQLNEAVRLLRVNTSESEITISTVPSSQFLLITVHSEKVFENATAEAS